MTREEFISKVCDLWVEGFDLLQSKVADANPTEEKMELLHASLKGKGKEYVTQWVKDYVLNHWDDDGIYGIIKWKTGEPKDTGEYLVCLKDGRITTSTFLVMDGCWGTTQGDWQRFNKSYINSWCKLSDIEPYKEE